jgi:hypothetical protein
MAHLDLDEHSVVNTLLEGGFHEVRLDSNLK